MWALDWSQCELQIDLNVSSIFIPMQCELDVDLKVSSGLKAKWPIEAQIKPRLSLSGQSGGLLWIVLFYEIYLRTAEILSPNIFCVCRYLSNRICSQPITDYLGNNWLIWKQDFILGEQIFDTWFFGQLLLWPSFCFSSELLALGLRFPILTFLLINIPSTGHGQ